MTQPSKSLRDSFFNKDHLVFLAIMLALNLAMAFAYFQINAHSFSRADHSGWLSVGLDQIIPFQPSWVFVYVLFYAYLFLPLFFFAPQRTKQQFIWGYFFVCLVSHTIHLVMPVALPRPTLEVTGFTSWLLNGIYNLDHPANTFPSIHVANTTLVTLFYSRHVASNRAVTATLWIITFLIAYSTVATRQHFFVDSIAGMVLAFVTYHLVLRWRP